jgi:hypothetical protein
MACVSFNILGSQFPKGHVVQHVCVFLLPLFFNVECLCNFSKITCKPHNVATLHELVMKLESNIIEIIIFLKIQHKKLSFKILVKHTQINIQRCSHNQMSQKRYQMTKENNQNWRNIYVLLFNTMAIMASCSFFIHMNVK